MCMIVQNNYADVIVWSAHYPQHDSILPSCTVYNFCNFQPPELANENLYYEYMLANE